MLRYADNLTDVTQVLRYADNLTDVTRVTVYTIHTLIDDSQIYYVLFPAIFLF